MCQLLHIKTELHRFVDGGMKDADEFINAVSTILKRGCHDENSCGNADGVWERKTNFYSILEILGLITSTGEMITPPTSKPTQRSRPARPTEARTKRPTLPPTSATVTAFFPQTQEDPQTPVQPKPSLSSSAQELRHTNAQVKQQHPTTKLINPYAVPNQQSNPSQPFTQTQKPSKLPSNRPTNDPTRRPTNNPTRRPSSAPTNRPTDPPSRQPTRAPMTPRPSPPPLTPRPTKQPTRMAPRNSGASPVWFGVSVNKKGND